MDNWIDRIRDSFFFFAISTASSFFFLPLPLPHRSTASFSYARNLQPLHHFRRVYPNEAGDTSDCELDDDDQGMETCCDCPVGDDMMDIDDGPVPVHESTGLGQTETDSTWDLHYSDEEVFPSPRDKDTSTQSKSDQGESWKMPSFRKPRDRKSSWSETSTASSSSSRRSSRSRSDNRKGYGSERRRRNSPPGSDREDLDDCFTFDPPGPTSSRRRNSVPGMFDTPDPTSSRRRNSVPSAGSSNSRSQRSFDENLASEFESRLYNFFFHIQIILLHLLLYFFDADFSIAPFPMVRLDNRTNTVCWFNSSVIGTIFLARSCNLTCPPEEKLDSFMAYFAMWYNEENSQLFFPQAAIRHLIQEMTDKNVEVMLREQREAMEFFTFVGGLELPPEAGSPPERGIEFMEFMKPSIGETTMPYRCRHCQEKGNAKICCSGTVFSINWQLVNPICSSDTKQCSFIVFAARKISCYVN